MGKFRKALPVAGLLASVAGPMGGYLSGQQPEYSPRPNAPALELLAPEFESSPAWTCQTPVLELEARTAVRTDLPVIEPRSWNPRSTSPFPLIVPGESTSSNIHTQKTHRAIPSADVIPQQSTLPQEPGWMKRVPQSVLEASSIPVSTGIARREQNGLPPLPDPVLSCPGHSHGGVSQLSRPGHTAPKRLSGAEPGCRTW
jgi:hypothetical protein